MSKLKIVFISNFLNHHQLELCNELINSGTYFSFISTEEIPQERLSGGYEDMSGYSFNINYYESELAKIKSEKLILDADVVIFGSAPYRLIKKRLKKKKDIYIYSERLFKEKGFKFRKIKMWFSKFLRFGLRRNKNVYLLLAGGYVKKDYNLTLSFFSKNYKWGYFPKLNNDFKMSKDNNSFIWVGRFIDWKQPEICILLAESFKNKNIDFKITMIGTGPLKEKIIEQVKNKNLESYIDIIGALPHSKVREFMEKSEFLLFTSDRNEGWGAVLNEAMNSKCITFANKEIGSTPYLIKEGYNGFIYSNTEELINKVENVIKFNQEDKHFISRNAYNTIQNEWNAVIAADRLLKVFNSNLNKTSNKIFESGPCTEE